jgi:DHA2 family multidrug resistance protein-like MFS transporter
VTAGSDPRRAGRREWIGLGVLALPCLLYAMDLTVLNLAVPAISRSLRPSSVELLWIVDIYGFVLAGSLITMGTLGDRIGRRRLLLAGAAGFAGASVLAAYSASAPMLIAARGQRRIAVGVWISSFSAGGAAGPLVGGLLLEWFWWGSVFLLAVPLMGLLLVLGPLLLPEFRDPRPGRLDLVSAVLSLVAVLALIYGLKQLADGGGPDWVAVVAIIVGAAAGTAFAYRQRRLADPLLDLQLFRRRGFTTALSTNVVSFFIGFGVLLFISQYLQLVLGLSPLAAGLWMLPSSAGFIGGSMLTPVLTRRAPPVFVMASGLALAAAGLGLLTQLGTGRTAGLALLVTGSVVFSVALAPVDTLATDMAVAAAPPERAGMATAITETSAEAGGALGIALLGVTGTSVYRSRVAGAVPAGIPADTARAARDTLGGAVAAAGQLPGRAGATLASAARQSFDSGLHVVFTISALLSLAAAVAVAALLRHLNQADPEQIPEPSTDATGSDTARTDGLHGR